MNRMCKKLLNGKMMVVLAVVLALFMATGVAEDTRILQDEARESSEAGAILARNADDTTVAFEDEIFLLKVYRILGKDEDEPLTVSEVAELTELNVAFCGIESLRGIEHFTALKSLDCSSNALSSLDVRFCPLLEKLDCTSNFLTSLDVTSNQKLVALACADNQLMILNISQNPALVTLFCYMNELTSLDVTQNPALEDLRCSNNQLTALDVSHNPVLARLYCHGNFLPSEDAIIGLDESLSDSYDSFDFEPQKDLPND